MWIGQKWVRNIFVCVCAGDQEELEGLEPLEKQARLSFINTDTHTDGHTDGQVDEGEGNLIINTSHHQQVTFFIILCSQSEILGPINEMRH